MGWDVMAKMRSGFSWLLAGAVVSIGIGEALAAFEGGNPAAGEAKAELCGGCHGVDGNSPVADFPSLAGQYEGYIVKQVRDFQTGARANSETMTGMAGMVASVEDAKDIAAYYASKKMAKAPIEPVRADVVKKGEKYYKEGNAQAGVYACINCHGERGKGKAPNITQFPRIGGQHRDYTIKQMNDFRDGARKNDPGSMMANIAKKMSDDEIMAVSEYLSAQLP